MSAPDSSLLVFVAANFLQESASLGNSFGYVPGAVGLSAEGHTEQLEGAVEDLLPSREVAASSKTSVSRC